jgi:glutamate formiminotransferase/formiminotetrahydrofolate cyclodeaminase
MERIVECVPNISEGRRPEVIQAIAAVVETVEGIRLLDVDPGRSTNRTVITFAGPPEAVGEAAFRLIREAAERIDMRHHTGEHPRMGATDVCPFVPVRGVTMEECVEIARALGERVGRELGIPGYYYERAATRGEFSNLAHCRKGQYEGLAKLAQPEWAPDFGPAAFTDRVRSTGAVAIGARDFLVAYNVNLNTTSTRWANAVAFDIRETGRVVKHPDGTSERVPGSLRAVKGIGWFIEEYGIAQLSLNLTDLSVTPVHVAFDEACARAADRGIRVTGSELVGLVPLRVLTDAADHYLTRQRRSLGIPVAEKIHIAVKSLGLDDLAPFVPEERIIEYLLQPAADGPLVSKTLRGFAEATASESPAPGGGSVAAYCGAVGAALAGMVANLSAHKRGWEDRWQEFSDVAVRAQTVREQLLRAVDEDTAAFNAILAAYALPQGDDAARAARQTAIATATASATSVPFGVAEVACGALELALEMARTGNPNSVTDAGVAALALRAAVRGAVLNVRVNAAGLDPVAARDWEARCAVCVAEADRLEAEVLATVDAVLAPAVS